MTTKPTSPATGTRADGADDTDAASTTDADWCERLTPMQYHVTREKGTERAFTGEFWDHKGDGVYRCVCCGQPLFDSRTKYDSGSGWPSFTAPVVGDQVATEADTSLGMVRTEVTCSQCDAHLGHVFPDGPAPTGTRFCINSAALAFASRDDGEEG